MRSWPHSYFKSSFKNNYLSFFLGACTTGRRAVWSLMVQHFYVIGDSPKVVHTLLQSASCLREPSAAQFPCRQAWEPWGVALLMRETPLPPRHREYLPRQALPPRASSKGGTKPSLLPCQFLGPWVGKGSQDRLPQGLLPFPALVGYHVSSALHPAEASPLHREMADHLIGPLLRFEPRFLCMHLLAHSTPASPISSHTPGSFPLQGFCTNYLLHPPSQRSLVEG